MTALLPALGLLDGRPMGGISLIEVHLEVAPLESSVSSQQLGWLQTFVAALASTFASDPGASRRLGTKRDFDGVTRSPSLCFMHDCTHALLLTVGMYFRGGRHGRIQ